MSCYTKHQVPIGLSVFVATLQCVILIIIIILQDQIREQEIYAKFPGSMYTGYWWGILLGIAAFFVVLATCIRTRGSLQLAIVINALITGAGVASISLPIFEIYGFNLKALNEQNLLLLTADNNATIATTTASPAINIEQLSNFFYAIVGLNSLSIVLMLIYIFGSMCYEACCASKDERGSYFEE